MWRDVQPRNLTLKRVCTHLTFHLSPRACTECVSVWQADELSIQSNEVIAQPDRVLQAAVHHNPSGPGSHLSFEYKYKLTIYISFLRVLLHCVCLLSLTTHITHYPFILHTGSQTLFKPHPNDEVMALLSSSTSAKQGIPPHIDIAILFMVYFYKQISFRFWTDSLIMEMDKVNAFKLAVEPGKKNSGSTDVPLLFWQILGLFWRLALPPAHALDPVCVLYVDTHLLYWLHILMYAF